VKSEKKVRGSYCIHTTKDPAMVEGRRVSDMGEGSSCISLKREEINGSKAQGRYLTSNFKEYGSVVGKRLGGGGGKERRSLMNGSRGINVANTQTTSRRKLIPCPRLGETGLNLRTRKSR